jgi:AcrR family transcriptional regulator
MSKGTATRERIIARAVELASTDGLNGLTIGRLAESTEMSKSGLFAHFHSKEELQIQVLEHAIAAFRATVVEPTLAAPGGEPRLRTAFERWLTWADEREEMPGGCLFMQASAELDDQPGAARELLADSRRQWTESLAVITRGAIKRGHFRDDIDPELFAFQLQGIILSWHQTHRLLRDPRASEHAHAALEALLASAHPPTP